MTLKKLPLISLFFCLVTANLAVADVDFSVVDVGVYYYPWWSDTASGAKNWSFCVDRPLLGFYDSDNVTVIGQHIAWLEELHVDFVILSWWGNNSFSDNCSKIFFDCLQNNYTWIKGCLMVESLGVLDYAGVYSYVYDNFVEPYSECYYTAEDGWGNIEPLLLFYNWAGMESDLPSNSSWATKISGHNSYVDWVYHDAVDVWKSTYEPKIRGRCFPIMPRYDERFCMPYRDTQYTKDTAYEDGWFADQWVEFSDCITTDRIDWLTICSFNEFEERSGIEPCEDRESEYGDWYIFNMTKENILRIKGLSDVTIEGGGIWYKSPFTFGIVIFAIVFGLYFMKRRY